MLNDQQKNNVTKNYKVINQVLRDMNLSDEYTGVASIGLCRAAQSYNPEKSNGAKFSTYAYRTIYNHLLKEVRRESAYKRRSEKLAYSLNNLVEDQTEYIDLLQSPVDFESDTIENLELCRKIDRFKSFLSTKEQKIFDALYDGFTCEDIALKFGFKTSEVINIKNSFKNFNKRVIFGFENLKSFGEDKDMISNQPRKTTERYLPYNYSVDKMVVHMKRRDMRIDHPLQRSAGQWNVCDKSNLIVSILTGIKIPEIILAEEYDETGSRTLWLLDGKQRCTTIQEFIDGQFKITKKIELDVIPYKYKSFEIKNGKEVYSDIETEDEYDIRGKSFAQLPKRLQEIILEYQICGIKYLGCSSDEVARLIRMYNGYRKMNNAQTSITYMPDFAATIKDMINHPFLLNKCNFSKGDIKSDIKNKVIMEAVMTNNFIDSWTKNPTVMGKFLNDNASEDMFLDVRIAMNRLDAIVHEEAIYTKHLNKTDLYIVLANFCEFIEKDSYSDLDYEQFLRYWFSQIEKAKESDTDGEGNPFVEYLIQIREGSKGKESIMRRLEIMRAQMNTWLSEHCIVKNALQL